MSPEREKDLRQRIAETVSHSVDPESSAAAVLIGVQDGPEPELLLTQRASHMNAHAGEVAFPGGKRDPEDLDLAATVLREAFEEVQLRAEHVELLVPLPQVTSRFGITVTPFVAHVDHEAPLQANPDEIAEIFTVPIAWLSDLSNRQLDSWPTEQGTRHEVRFVYKDFTIWGLTAMMIRQFLHAAYDVDLQLPDA